MSSYHGWELKLQLRSSRVKSSLEYSIAACLDCQGMAVTSMFSTLFPFTTRTSMERGACPCAVVHILSEVPYATPASVHHNAGVPVPD